jgi:hypothetical protein
MDNNLVLHHPGILLSQGLVFRLFFIYSASSPYDFNRKTAFRQKSL